MDFISLGIGFVFGMLVMFFVYKNNVNKIAQELAIAKTQYKNIVTYYEDIKNKVTKK